MTPQLFERFQSRLAPFDGHTVYTIDDADPMDVLATMNAIADKLTPDYPAIQTYEDWHEHDGFLVSDAHTDWFNIRRPWTSIQTWLAASPIDHCVRLSVYPCNCEWLLRCSVTSDSHDGVTEICPFLDFTAAANSRAETVVHMIRQMLPAHSVTTNATEYFRICYAG